MNQLAVAAAVGLLGALTLAAAVQSDPPANQKKLFDKTVAPLLTRYCLDCHSGAKPRGALDLTQHKSVLAKGSKGPIVVPGNAAASRLWQHVQAGKMPPKKPLGASEKEILRKWIDAGAHWGSDPIDPFQFTTDTRSGYDWWSLQPVVRPTLPKVQHKSWPRNPVDHFVLAKQEAKDLTPSKEATRQTLIGRLYQDLIGLPPTPEEVQAFAADDSPDAYEQLVDRLLASPHYGERWARHWLDVVRFGESNGFEHDELRPNAWPYRDWVIAALNEDMPFDQFARWQLAGDILASADPRGIIATGFLVAGGYDTVGQQQQSAAMKAVVRQDELEDIVGTVGQTFLGLTVHCARCHDHKFDPVLQKEYYQLTAALGGVYHGERNILAPEALEDFTVKEHARQTQLAKLREQLHKLESPIRQQILAELKKSSPTKSFVLEPLANWKFTKGPNDSIGALHAKLQGDAKLGPDGLHVSGKTGYAATPPLSKDIKARTLAALVRLDNLTQRGGGVMSLQSLDGNTFDAIVFGETQPGRWLAGSEFFKRSKPLQGPLEMEADKQAIHIAIVYSDDGTITAFRNGKLHGQSYKSDGPLPFAAGKAQVVFGVRHTPAQPGKMLAGIIAEAALFDRALAAEEVAALAGKNMDYVPEKEIVARLDPAAKSQRADLLVKIQALDELLKSPAPKKMVYAAVSKHPAPAHLLIRGNPAQKGELVAAGGVSSLQLASAQFGLGQSATDAERRQKLADWITHPKNPLFARVIVNRLWQHHFGTGLVDTPNDFGFNGGRPSHPELLDWLADELACQKFSLKAMHRLMVTSATYRQASTFNAKAAKVDAGNRLLWRKSPTRLEAEAVRDTILHVAGQLSPKMGGPGFQDFKVTIRGSTYLYAVADSGGIEFQRRTIYRTTPRSGRNPLLDTLDCPDPSAAAHKRQVTTTPLQALALLNNAFMLRMAEKFAERVKMEAGPDVPAQITRAYWLAYGRSPAPNEITAARGAVEAHGLFVLCRALLNSNEFIYID